MGVLYHLRHPLLALDLIHEHAARDLLLFQTMLRGAGEIEPIEADYDFRERELFERPGAPRMQFIEHRFADDPTNWWVPNAACAEAMLRSAGFEILSRPEEEVWLCRRSERPQWSGPVYPACRKPF
jgi:tRNA (mo5U34)-methyltransferase